MNRNHNSTNTKRECKQLVGAALDFIFTLDANSGWWAVLRLTLEAFLALVLGTHPLVASTFLAAVVRTAGEYPLLLASLDVAHRGWVLDVDNLLRLHHHRLTLSHHWLTWLHHHWLTWLHHHRLRLTRHHLLLLHGLSLHNGSSILHTDCVLRLFHLVAFYLV